jgi:hypothetical protein
MKMTLVDKSECFRAFLLLIGQDGKITREEREFLLVIGKKLDLERGFVETSIDDVLENRHITAEPPRLSRKEFAESLLKDAIEMAFSDDEFHQKEFTWLMSIAEENALPKEWLEDALKAFKESFSGRHEFHIRKYV